MFADHSGCKSNNIEEQKYLFSLLLKVHRSKKSKNLQIKKKIIGMYYKTKSIIENLMTTSLKALVRHFK